jgi:hypothetical protein
VEDLLEEDHYSRYFTDGSAGPGERTTALEELHERQVAIFVMSPSFGVARIRSPLFVARSPVSTSVEMPASGFAVKPWEFDRKVSKPLSDITWSLHRDSIANFLSPTRFGYAKDRRHVAGFQSHQFGLPLGVTITKAPAKQYRLQKLELVSLLTHDEPAVYVTENLPRMDKVRDVPVRSLDEFERSGLQRLWQGDDLKVSEEGNRVRLLGSIRAGKQCLVCHDAQRGDLLGAFSYRLTSEP